MTSCSSRSTVAAVVLVVLVPTVTSLPGAVRIARPVADELPTNAARISAVEWIGDETFDRQQHQKLHEVATALRALLDETDHFVLFLAAELDETFAPGARRVAV